MNDLPFGFSFGDDPNDNSSGDRRRNEGHDPNAGFDANALGQMFSQLGQMFSGMGSGMTAGTGGGPVNYETAAQLARQRIGSFKPILAGEEQAAVDAVRLAEVWLDDATTLPAGITVTKAWTPVQWLEETLPTWKQLCDPIAAEVGNAWQQNLPEEARGMAGPMIGMFTQMSSMTFGTQLGQGLGVLAGEVLTSSDIGLPLAPEHTRVLLPEAIAKFADGLDLPAQEIIVFLAAREAAHQRLFAHVPWLKQRLLTSVEEYARGISVNLSGLNELSTSIDPQELLSNPAKIEELMGSLSAFEPQTTPGQQAALKRLETLLALTEGWVETVVTAALGDRIPSTAALTETMRRRRATGGPAEQTFASLIGLDLRPRKLREAAQLWQRLAEASDLATRDGVWAHPDLLPDADDLDSPAAFIDRVIGGSALDDPIAELERTIAEEQRGKAGEQRGGADGGSERADGSTGKTDDDSGKSDGDKG